MPDQDRSTEPKRACCKIQPAASHRRRTRSICSLSTEKSIPRFKIIRDQQITLQECLWHSCCEVHVMHCMTYSSVHLCNPPEAISDGRLNPATNTSLLPAAYSGSHLPSDIKWQNKHFSLFCHFCIKRTFAIRFSVLSLSEQKLRKHHVT